LARDLFTRIKALDPTKHGMQLENIQKECTALAALLDDRQAYRSAIMKRIEARRQARGFPADPDCLEATQLV
jgi:hypothetical protein